MINILENISLKHYNTFGIDIKARYFVKVRCIDDLTALLQTKYFQENRRIIIGGGSNLLFRHDFQGIIILVEIKGVHYQGSTQSSTILKVGAGENWNEFVELCVKNRLYGIENLVYIPGKVGAAPVQNIGAYGVEQKDFLHKVEYFDISTGKIVILHQAECKFDYRSSIFKNELEDKAIITNVYYELSREWKPNINYKDIKQELDKFTFVEPDAEYVMNTVKRVRKNKLPAPSDIGNAGSFFKNPVVDEQYFYTLKEKYPDIPYFQLDNQYKIPAAYLIEKCGWKGYRSGNCGVYDHHSLILVNYGNASGEEIFQLSENIRQSVQDEFGILLEREVIVVE